MGLQFIVRRCVATLQPQDDCLDFRIKRFQPLKNRHTAGLAGLPQFHLILSLQFGGDLKKRNDGQNANRQ